MGAIEKIKEGVLPASEVSELLRPISSQSSAGHSIRSESLFTEIRFARDGMTRICLWVIGRGH